MEETHECDVKFVLKKLIKKNARLSREIKNLKWLVKGLMDETGNHPHKVTNVIGGYPSDPETETTECFCNRRNCHDNVADLGWSDDERD